MPSQNVTPQGKITEEYANRLISLLANEQLPPKNDQSRPAAEANYVLLLQNLMAMGFGEQIGINQAAINKLIDVLPNSAGQAHSHSGDNHICPAKLLKDLQEQEAGHLILTPEQYILLRKIHKKFKISTNKIEKTAADYIHQVMNNTPKEVRKAVQEIDAHNIARKITECLPNSARTRLLEYMVIKTAKFAAQYMS